MHIYWPPDPTNVSPMPVFPTVLSVGQFGLMWVLTNPKVTHERGTFLPTRSLKDGKELVTTVYERKEI